jgi:hypothetical protein
MPNLHAILLPVIFLYISIEGSLSMVRQIRKLLSGVRTRQRQSRSLEWMIRGAFVGVMAGITIEILRLCDFPIQAWLGVAVVFGCALTFGLIGLLVPIKWQSTARLIDGHYGMKDTTITALDFAGRKSDDPLIFLQLQQAIAHLQRVNPRLVVPIRPPKLVPVVAALGALLFSLPFLPRRTINESVVDTTLQQVVNEQVENIESTVIEEIRELAEKSENPELKEMVEEVEELVEDLKKPNIDQREALAKLSEIQQTMAEAAQKFNPEKTDAELKEMAAALEPAESMKPIADALKDGKYDKAAEQLEKMDPNSMSRKEKDAVAANLKKFSEKLGEGKQGQLSESAKEMQEGLEKENESQCKSGACKAAGVCKSQALKKSISNCLNCQLNRLAECKGQCQTMMNGGEKIAKSEKDSNKWGKGATNKPLGEESTKLDTQRHQETLTGVQGEGQSERETSQSPEGEQEASRSFKERYTEFRKQMEEVLDNEPLPLGHRETVRKYFESIRPTNQEMTE